MQTAAEKDMLRSLLIGWNNQRSKQVDGVRTYVRVMIVRFAFLTRSYTLPLNSSTYPTTSAAECSCATTPTYGRRRIHQRAH